MSWTRCCAPYQPLATVLVPPDKDRAPAGNRSAKVQLAGGTDATLDHAQPNSVEHVVLVELAHLLAEVRPDIPLAIIHSLIAEALDAAAGRQLDLAWAYARERLYPLAVAVAKDARVGLAYAERRAAELEDARPRPGDFRGRPHLRAIPGGDAA